MMCFHMPVFSGNCNRDYVLLQSESIWGFGFSILTGEDSHIFCFHIFFIQFFYTFLSPISRFFSYYSSYLYAIPVIVHTAEKKKETVIT